MLVPNSYLLYFLSISLLIQHNSAILRCYQCNGSNPDCDWETYSTDCPQNDDICVTIVETNKDHVHYTKGCLSYIDDIRFDIPIRRNRGCRPAKRLTSTVSGCNNATTDKNNAVITYDDVTYCFCRFHDDCVNNGARSTLTIVAIGLLAMFTTLLAR